jgi:hypothetical protein
MIGIGRIKPSTNGEYAGHIPKPLQKELIVLVLVVGPRKFRTEDKANKRSLGNLGDELCRPELAVELGAPNIWGSCDVAQFARALRRPCRKAVKLTTKTLA